MARLSRFSLTATSPSGARLVLIVAWTCLSTATLGLQVRAPQTVDPGAHALVEAARLRAEGTPDALRQAAAKAEEAIAVFRETGQSAAEADALVVLGDVSQRLSDYRRGLDAYTRALAVYRARQDRGGEAKALASIGATQGRLSDYRAAVAAFQDALALFRASADGAGEAGALAGMGAAHVRLNEYEKAREVLDRSIPLYQALGDRGGEAAALQSLGYALFSQDDYPAAIAAYETSLSLARAAGQRSLEATVVYSIGQTYYHLGDYQRALELYNQALAAHRALFNRSAEAAALSAIGRVYRFLGDYQRALDHHSQAIVILRAIGERMNEATSLNNSGHVHLSMGEYRKALPFFEQSLEICKAVGNQAGIASNTNGIGLVHAGLGEYDTALAFHDAALGLFRQLGHRRAEADSLGHIGRASAAQGRHAQAREYLSDALAIYRSIGVPRQESETLYAIARADRALDDLPSAGAHLDAAIRLTEGFRQDVSSQQLRTSYQATVRDLYELKIDVLMRRHERDPTGDFAARALETSERARARSLLDILAEARTDIRLGVDATLLERERTLRQLLAGRAARLNELAGARPDPAQLAAMTREIDVTVADYDDVQAKIRDSSPRYAALMQPQPLSLGDIQTRVLDGDTVLLEYFLGAERSYVWAVTQDGVEGYVLPDRTRIEAEARALHQLAMANAAGDALAEAARQVSTTVLAPAASQLNRKRVAIAADGALHYVPFGALPTPMAGATTTATAPPLIVRHEIVNLPSASTLAVLRREAAGRAPAPNLVAVVADPVFDANDVRVRRNLREKAVSAAEPLAQHAGLRRSAADLGFAAGSWPPPRLLGTRREARAILSLAPAAKRREALGFDASRETATAAELGTYRVIHFATHALVNNHHPELSGLVLSLVDSEGRPRDGFLRLNDIYNLRLAADLVVLSACQTGLGQEIRSEGLVGLTRGFMYAGSPRLLTSLWPVDDRATSELMGRFYRGLLGPRQLTPAAALRDAQIEMWRQKDWQSLYYWAAFTLQGEWQQSAQERQAAK